MVEINAKLEVITNANKLIFFNIEIQSQREGLHLQKNHEKLSPDKC